MDYDWAGHGLAKPKLLIPLLSLMLLRFFSMFRSVFLSFDFLFSYYFELLFGFIN